METNHQLPRALATSVDALITRFPHLSPIISTWGTRECRDLLSSLALDTRDGQRTGFPPEHASTVFRLLMAHDTEFPDFEVKVVTKWYEL